MENYAIVQKSVEALKIERRNLINKLNMIEGIQAFDSKTNFVLFNTDKSYDDVYLRVLKQGLVIKKLGRLLRYQNCLRSTVGLPETNEKLLKALKEYLSDEK